jgi:hypothetical protein
MAFEGRCIKRVPRLLRCRLGRDPYKLGCHIGIPVLWCEIGEYLVSCWCENQPDAEFYFGYFDVIPVRNLNTPVQASGPDPEAVPAYYDVAQIYPIDGFVVDWTAGHDGAVAAGILVGACGTSPTTCILEERQLGCICRDLVISVSLGYEALRPPDSLELSSRLLE